MYSSNLFAFSKNNATKLINDDDVSVNIIDYVYPYGYSISMNVGVGF
ncbi:MAG: hypothetical protein V1779_00930 [bacterium]